MECKRSILATQIHLKNIQLGQPSPQIVADLIDNFEGDAKEDQVEGEEDVEMQNNQSSHQLMPQAAK